MYLLERSVPGADIGTLRWLIVILMVCQYFEKSVASHEGTTFDLAFNEKKTILQYYYASDQ